MLLNLEYIKLKLSSFAVNLHNSEPLIALFDTEATCSCISHHLFTKISDKGYMMQKSLRVNTASVTTL